MGAGTSQGVGGEPGGSRSYSTDGESDLFVGFTFDEQSAMMGERMGK